MKAGDVVWVKFPYEGKDADKLHPALVLDVLESETGRTLVLAYGSSKQVDRSSPPQNEVTVIDPEDVAACGLRVPTRFDLSVRATMLERLCRCVGALPQHKYKQLYRAAVYCHLIQA